MLEDLLSSPAKLAFAIASLSVINFFVSRLALAEQSRQGVDVHIDAPKSGDRGASSRGQSVKPFVMPAMISVFMFVADRLTRELLGGGWLVLQIANLGLATTDVFTFRALQRPHAADGRVRYSVAYHYQVAAARSLGMAIVAAIVGLLFGSWAFMTGAALIFATGVGWYRRAAQARSHNEVAFPGKPPC